MIFRGGRGMGLCRVGGADTSFFNADCLGLDDRPGKQGAVRDHPCRRHQFHDILAGFYQHRYGNGVDAGGGGSPAFYQLRRVFHPDIDAEYWRFNQHQYATIYA